ncbi:hypothetical protein ABZ567_14825 [Streptomyces sp. NPDC016459]
MIRQIDQIGRHGTAQDVALALLHRAADASAFMTGESLRPNGGAATPW